MNRWIEYYLSVQDRINYGILVLNVNSDCTFHCRNCSSWYKGKNQRKGVTAEETRKLFEHLDKEGILPRNIILHGGEPFLNPEFGEIVNIVEKYCAFKIVSNGTMLTRENVELMKRCEFVSFSVYPGTRAIYDKLQESKILKDLQTSCRSINYAVMNSFDNINGGEREPQSNFEQCSWQKICKVISPEGLYRCWFLYKNNEDAYPLTREGVLECLSGTKAFERCRYCTPELREPHVSDSPEIDKKAVEQALRTIDAYS